MNIALKEWAPVVSAMAEGEHHFLLRKGGLLDRGGNFTLQQEKFWLFPAWEHASSLYLKPPYKDQLPVSARPEFMMIQSFAVVEKVFQVKSQNDFAPFLPFTIWTPDYVTMRLNYKPEKPLWGVWLKVYRLAVPHQIKNEPRYAGCKSWVELDSILPETLSSPAWRVQQEKEIAGLLNCY